MNKTTGIEKALAVAGSQAKLAAMLGVSGPLIHRWVRRGYSSPHAARALERELGIPRREFLDPRLVDLVQGS